MHNTVKCLQNMSMNNDSVIKNDSYLIEKLVIKTYSYNDAEAGKSRW